MARPIKKGIDYFPLDVVLDTKFELIEAEFKLTGFAIVVKLFQKIYGECGYYCEWTNEVALLFARKNGVGVNVVSEIVKAALKRGIFDKEMFDKFSILTSAGIQSRYVEAKRGDFSKICHEHLLISVPKIGEGAAKNRVYATKTEDNDNNNPLKKSKENEIKEDKSIIYETITGTELPEKIIEAYSMCFLRNITSTDRNLILKWLKTFDVDIICEAFRLTKEQGKSFIGYTRGILENWYKEGVTDYVGYLFGEE